MAPGPGGGGEGIFLLYVWFLRLLSLLALAVCVALLPRGDAWNSKAVVVSIVLWGLIFTGAIFLYLSRGVTVSVRAIDMTGRPLPGARMEYRWWKRLPLMVSSEGSGTATADSRGIATFRVPTFRTLYVFGDLSLHPTHELAIYSWGPELRVVHSKDGASDRNTYSATVRKGSELDLSVEFDPPAPSGSSPPSASPGR